MGDSHARREIASSKDLDGQNLPRYERMPKGQHTRLIDENRLKGFISEGQWADINLRSMLYDDIYTEAPNVELFVCSIPDLQRPKFAEAIKGEFRPAKVGEVFGPSWSTHWFRIHVTVPEKHASAERVEMHFDIGGEGMIWTTEGVPLHGLTGGTWRDRRTDFIIPKGWKMGKEHIFYIETSMNGMFGCHPEAKVMPKDGLDIGAFTKPPDPNRKFNFAVAELRIPNMDAWRLFWDYYMLQDIAQTFPNNSWEAQRCWQIAVDIINAFRRGDRESLFKGRTIAQKLFGDDINTDAVWKDKSAENMIYAIGHCHIDTAWLWPFAETKRKVARSWSTQCDLMDRYPEHTFAASTAQQYTWLKEEYPGLFERVKARVKEGRFVPVGGSWVEFDSHYASGESLVRQFLVGQRFFESNFGSRCKTGWLPDTFGYSAQLPQLLESAGMNYFFTQKISWNSVNHFPHTTFKWVGLDGTQVLTHMAPTETYGAQVTADELRWSTENHKNLREDNTSMLLFGNGDGGGGPLAPMIEKLRRVEGLAKNVGGSIPHLKISTPDVFFAQLESKVKRGVKLATHHGDIYLESCRGCYTTQAKTKRNNRKAENYLRDLELLCTLASIHDTNWMYPKRLLDDLWQTVLLCHFHDVLPGSAIEMVFEDADKLYEDLFKKCDTLFGEVSSHLHMGGEGELAALNLFQWPRTELVEIPKSTELIGENQVSQKLASGAILVPVSAKANASTPVLGETMATGQVTVKTVDSQTHVLANDKVKITLVGGEITSFVDLDLDRELIPPGEKGNKLVLYYDQAMTFWDAWDVEVYHLEMPEYLGAGSVQVLETGPLRASLEVTHQISAQSSIKSTISLDAHLPPSPSSPASSSSHPIQSLIKISCDVSWHETRRMLKVEFPWSIHADHATYETQFGLLRAPTHYNTSWDYARFENVCHRFADLSEFGYGIAILNDCKYGFETQGNVQRLSLLRSPKGPDPNADMGAQRFRYAVAPHRGGFLEADVVRAGMEFNEEMRVLRVADAGGSSSAALNATLSSIRIEGPRNVILSNVKRGEDDEGLDGHYDLPKRAGKSVVLRVYESMGGEGRACIRTAKTLDVKRAFKTNILEDDLEELPVLEDGAVGFVCKPFEIVTIRLQL